MRQTFEINGQVGHDLLAVDWDATPLGPLDSWPQSLQSVVRLVQRVGGTRPTENGKAVWCVLSAPS